MKKILGALAVVVMITLIAPAPAQAQATGDVDLSIDFTSGILILYYYSDLTVEFDPTVFYNMTGFDGGTGGEYSFDEGTPAAAIGVVDGTTDTVTADFADPTLTAPGDAGYSAVELTLQDVWAVRGFGTGSGVRVAIAGETTNPLVDTSGTSEIAMTSWGVTDGATTGASIDFAYPGLFGTPVVGDVYVTLDLTDVTVADVHTTAGVEYTLTATSY